MPITSGTTARTGGGGGFTNPLLVPLTIDADNIPLFLNRSAQSRSNLIAFQTAGSSDWEVGEEAGSNTFSFFSEGRFGTKVFSLSANTNNAIVDTALTFPNIAAGKILKLDSSQNAVAAVPGTDYVIPSQLTGFIQNQNVAAQPSANAWIDGQYIASNADYLTILTAGELQNVDTSGGFASWSIVALSAMALGAYWVELNGAMLFNGQVGASQAPVIPTDLVRLNELQLPYGTWKAQTGALTVMSITSNTAADSLYELSASVNWLVGGTQQLQLQLLFTDENGTAQVLPIYPVGQADTSVSNNNMGGAFPKYFLFPTVSFWAKANTTIQVRTVVVIAGTFNYDVAAWVRYIFQRP